jgi:hypothetical protein
MRVMRTLGAALGAAIVLLFLASVASRLTWSNGPEAGASVVSDSH